MAWILRFCSRIQKRILHNTEYGLNAEELEIAEKILSRTAQREVY